MLCQPTKQASHIVGSRLYCHRDFSPPYFTLSLFCLLPPALSFHFYAIFYLSLFISFFPLSLSMVPFFAILISFFSPFSPSPFLRDKEREKCDICPWSAPFSLLQCPSLAIDQSQVQMDPTTGQGAVKACCAGGSLSLLLCPVLRNTKRIEGEDESPNLLTSNEVSVLMWDYHAITRNAAARQVSH